MKKVLFSLMCMMIVFSACDNGSTPNNTGVIGEIVATEEEKAQIQAVLDSIPNVSMVLESDSAPTPSIRPAVRTLQSNARSGAVQVGDAAEPTITGNALGDLGFTEMFSQLANTIASTNPEALLTSGDWYVVFDSDTITATQVQGKKMSFTFSDGVSPETFDCDISNIELSTNNDGLTIIKGTLDYNNREIDYLATISYTHDATTTTFEAWFETHESIAYAGESGESILDVYYTSTYPKTEKNSFSIADGHDFRGLFYSKTKLGTDTLNEDYLPFKGKGSGGDKLESLTVVSATIPIPEQVTQASGYFENTKTDGIIYSLGVGTQLHIADKDGKVYVDKRTVVDPSTNMSFTSYDIPLYQLELDSNATLTAVTENVDIGGEMIEQKYFTTDGGTTRFYTYDDVTVSSLALPDDADPLHLRPGVKAIIDAAETKVTTELTDYPDFTVEETTMPTVPTF